jgi:flavin reductase (DIM6/NTAB) family NADH-FMN oxidoreductase RutF
VTRSDQAVSLVDANDDVAEALYRMALSHLPSGVTIVTSSDAEGHPRGATVSACMSLSLRPALILISLDNTAGTLDAINHSGRFAVHILGEEDDEVASRFAANGGDKFSATPHARNEAGTPLLEEYAARIECHLHDLHPAGDHTLVIGAIDRIATEEEGASSPLLWYRRGFHRLRSVGGQSREHRSEVSTPTG